MKRIFFILSCFLSLACFSQTKTDQKDSVILISVKGDTILSPGYIFEKVEIESEFPGGIREWQKFLAANLEYPEKAVRKRIQGTVVVQFIVCTDGTVCNIEAISGPKDLRKAALEAIKNTPNWTPAVQDGKTVKSYKKQPIIFRLE